MDLLPWIIRAILIMVGVILAIMIWKGKKKGRYQRYDFSFFVIGINALIMGVILLLVSFLTGLSFDYAMFLTAAGAIGIIIGLLIRNTWEKNH